MLAVNILKLTTNSLRMTYWHSNFATCVKESTTKSDFRRNQITLKQWQRRHQKEILSIKQLSLWSGLTW